MFVICAALFFFVSSSSSSSLSLSSFLSSRLLLRFPFSPPLSGLFLLYGRPLETVSNVIMHMPWMQQNLFGAVITFVQVLPMNPCPCETPDDYHFGREIFIIVMNGSKNSVVILFWGRIVKPFASNTAVGTETKTNDLVCILLCCFYRNPRKIILRAKGIHSFGRPQTTTTITLEERSSLGMGQKRLVAS